MRTGGKGEGDRGSSEEDLNRAYVFMLVGMLSLGALVGACGASCLLALLGGGW